MKKNYPLKHSAEVVKGSGAAFAAEMGWSPSKFSAIVGGYRKVRPEDLKKLKTILGPERFAKAFPE